jgi:hypothetical protein
MARAVTPGGAHPRSDRPLAIAGWVDGVATVLHGHEVVEGDGALRQPVLDE